MKASYWMSPWRTRIKSVPEIDDDGKPTGRTIKAAFVVANLAKTREDRKNGIELEFASADLYELQPQERNKLVGEAVAKSLNTLFAR